MSLSFPQALGKECILLFFLTAHAALKGLLVPTITGDSSPPLKLQLQMKGHSRMQEHPPSRMVLWVARPRVQLPLPRGAQAAAGGLVATPPPRRQSEESGQGCSARHPENESGQPGQLSTHLNGTHHVCVCARVYMRACMHVYVSACMQVYVCVLDACLPMPVCECACMSLPCVLTCAFAVPSHTQA